MSPSDLQVLHALLSRFEDFTARRYEPSNYDSPEAVQAREMMETIEKISTHI